MMRCLTVGSASPRIEGAGPAVVGPCRNSQRTPPAEGDKPITGRSPSPPDFEKRNLRLTLSFNPSSISTQGDLSHAADTFAR